MIFFVRLTKNPCSVLVFQLWMDAYGFVGLNTIVLRKGVFVLIEPIFSLNDMFDFFVVPPLDHT